MSDGRELLRAFYVGINTGNALYGVQLALYFKTMRILLTNKGALKGSNIFYALFSTLMLLLITVWVASQVIFGHKMWLLNINFPGGPYAYWNVNMSAWYMEWARVAVIILQLMTDALLIYRCRMIWNSNRVVVVPIILWLASLTLGVLRAWVIRLPWGYPNTSISAGFAIPYWAVSVFLNTTLTCMICHHVMRHGREHLGHDYASLCSAVASIIIESVLPCTLSGIVLLVVLVADSQTYAAFISVYVLMMCISPQMLILQVVVGKARDSDMSNRPGSPIKFNRASVTTSG